VQSTLENSKIRSLKLAVGVSQEALEDLLNSTCWRTSLWALSCRRVGKDL
jgi:hypothetical protein